MMVGMLEVTDRYADVTLTGHQVHGPTRWQAERLEGPVRGQGFGHLAAGLRRLECRWQLPVDRVDDPILQRRIELLRLVVVPERGFRFVAAFLEDPP